MTKRMSGGGLGCAAKLQQKSFPEQIANTRNHKKSGERKPLMLTRA